MTSATGCDQKSPNAKVDQPPTSPLPATAIVAADEPVKGDGSDTKATGQGAETQPVAEIAAVTVADPKATAPGVLAGEVKDTATPVVDTPVVPEKPLKVLLLGDSMIATGFGAMLEKQLDAHPNITCYRKGKSASGLARPDFFNWMEEAKKQLEYRKPDLVLVVIGGNDGQDLTTRSGKGKRVHWKSDGWPQAYQDRMQTFLTKLDPAQRKVIWLGLPKMGMRSLEKKLVMIRDLQKQAVSDIGGEAVYMSSNDLLADETGELPKLVKRGKKKRALRADDGIHFTMSGSEYYAEQVAPEVVKALNLPPKQ